MYKYFTLIFNSDKNNLNSVFMERFCTVQGALSLEFDLKNSCTRILDYIFFYIWTNFLINIFTDILHLLFFFFFVFFRLLFLFHSLILKIWYL